MSKPIFTPMIAEICFWITIIGFAGIGVTVIIDAFWGTK